MEDSGLLLKSDETNALLKDVVNELRNIRAMLSRQDAQIEALSGATLIQNASDGSYSSQSETKRVFSDSSGPTSQDISLSTSMRTGPILQEAITRYNSNRVSSWNSLYGTHQRQGEIPTFLEDLICDIEWPSVVGQCWKIPHDNRVSFCFRDPMCDIKTAVQVRNYLDHFHRLKFADSPRGKYFNVWDWFDTGLSAYWYPGIKKTAMPIEAQTMGFETVTTCKTLQTLSVRVAPWRRMINFQGLTSLSNCDDSTILDNFEDQELCPFIAETKDSIFQEPMDEVLWRVIRCHLRCLRVAETEHVAMQTKGWAMFHITFYEILEVDPHNISKDLWPSGELHSDDQGDKGRPRRIRESALTLLAVPSAELPGPPIRSIYWTMLCMRPHQFPHLYYAETRDDLSRGRTHEMLDDMSDLVHLCLLTLIEKWEEIAEYFDRLLVERNGLLNPEYHDSLLTDDSKFTRSKKYFWAIEFLKEAEYSIVDNIKQAERFVDLLTTNPPATEMGRKAFSTRLKKHYTNLDKLEAVKIRFRSKKDEAKALRDGLFSASAVIESRAATQQGENIKLLTYASIFFLPLTFCMSVWSINNTLFSLSSLAIVVPIVSLSTYAIVLNLNNVVYFFQPSRTGTHSPSFLERFIDAQVKAMQQDDQGIWRERGDALAKARALNQPSCTVSQWYCVQFLLQQAALAVLCVPNRIGDLIPHGASGRKRRDRNTRDHPVLPATLGHLGDVRVQVQVDVDIETAGVGLSHREAVS